MGGERRRENQLEDCQHRQKLLKQRKGGGESAWGVGYADIKPNSMMTIIDKGNCIVPKKLLLSCILSFYLFILGYSFFSLQYILPFLVAFLVDEFGLSIQFASSSPTFKHRSYSTPYSLLQCSQTFFIFR